MHIHHGFSSSSRPCDYSIGFQDSSVYSDFNLNSNESLYLVRISFDGYGCCSPEWENEPIQLNREDSKLILRMLDENDFENPIYTTILSNYFKSCGKAIWQDALEEHELI